jgi:tetratricopeptide (TPR) repeat protein
MDTMQSLKNIVRLTCFIFLLFSVNGRIYGGQQDVSAVKAMQLFDAGNYSEAEKFFRILLEEDPGNPMLNYYYGASRTENGHFDDKDLKHLQQAGKNVTPDRLNYYLGIQFHARNNWEQALKFYNQFRLSVPENEQQKLKLAEKIQQCFNQENPFIASAITQNPDQKKEKEETDKTNEEIILQETSETHAISEEPETFHQNEELVETIQQAKNEVSQSEFIPEKDSKKAETKTDDSGSSVDFNIGRKALPDLPGVKTTYELPEGEKIDFRVNNSITYLFSSQFQTNEGKQLFEQGLALQKELNQNIKEVNKLRDDYKKEINYESKENLGEKILTLETDSYRLQDEIKQKFSAARNVENQFWNHAGSVAVYNFQLKNEKIESVLRGETPEPETTIPEQDSIVILPLAVSEMYESKPNETNQPTGNLVYKIQIGAYSRGVPAYRQRLYNKLSLIRKIDNYTDENDVVVYTTGNLTNLEDAEKMRKQVRQEGIEDAIVVPYFNGKRITLEQAKKIEAEDDI